MRWVRIPINSNNSFQNIRKTDFIFKILKYLLANIWNNAKTQA